MASLGSASLVLTAQTSKLEAGLNNASQKVKGWADKQQSALSGAFSNFKAGAAFGAGMIAVNALVGGVQKLIGGMGELADHTDKIAKLSRNLGMPTESLSALEHAAGLSGVSMETLESGLVKFRQKATGPLDEALYGVAARLEGITEPGERARILVENFGKTGVKMGTLFEGGKDGLKNMIEEAKRLGIAFNDVEAGKIEAANDAIAKVKGALTGLWRRALVSIAPVIEMISGKLTQAFEYLMPIFQKVFTALTTHWGIIIDIMGEVFGAIGEVIQIVVDWVSELFNLGNVSMTVEEIVTGVWRAIGIGAAYVWDTIKAGAGAIAIVAGLIVEGFGYVVEAFKEVISLAKELPDSIRPDWVDDMIAGTERFERSVKKTGREMKKWGIGTFDNFGKSADDVRRWFDNRGKGKDAAPVKKAGGAELPEQKQATYTAVAAALKGSKEEASIVARFKFNNLVNPQLDVNKKQLEEAKRANQLLNEVVRAVTGVKLDLEVF